MYAIEESYLQPFNKVFQKVGSSGHWEIGTRSRGISMPGHPGHGFPQTPQDTLKTLSPELWARGPHKTSHSFDFSPREGCWECNNICIPKSRAIDPTAVLQRVDEQTVQNYISVCGAGKFVFQSYECCCATLPLHSSGGKQECGGSYACTEPFRAYSVPSSRGSEGKGCKYYFPRSQVQL